MIVSEREWEKKPFQFVHTTADNFSQLCGWCNELLLFIANWIRLNQPRFFGLSLMHQRKLPLIFDFKREKKCTNRIMFTKVEMSNREKEPKKNWSGENISLV